MKGINLTSDIWDNENLLRRVFSWQTRLGIAPKFGSCPIGWYQAEQVECLDAIKKGAEKQGLTLERVRYKQGKFQAFHCGKWITFSVNFKN